MVIGIPYTAHDAQVELSNGDVDATHTFYWRCYYADGIHYRIEKLELDITDEDFKNSLERNIMRKPTIYVPTCIDLIDPDDKYVQIIADTILSKTTNQPDKVKIRTALYFVQSTIEYAYDSDLYGCSDFYATPLETLYLRQGDCDDTTILLASILIAMGYDDCVLLDYPGHWALGIRWDGQEDYLLCETTASIPCDLRTSLLYDGDMPVIHKMSEKSKALTDLNTVFIAYRNGIQKYLGF